MAENLEQKETNILKNNQLCIAIEYFMGQEAEDLPFKIGDKLWIVKPSGLMFWYIARNENGKTGMVPGSFLKPVDDDPPIKSFGLIAISIAEKERVTKDSRTVDEDDDDDDDSYIHMNPSDIHQAKKADMEVKLAQVKEKHRRLRPGTLVVAIRPFLAQESTDLSFEIHDEIMILNPLPDLCWYQAQKVNQPSKKGSIPITHVRLVYMSSDEEEGLSSKDDDERLYDDVNDFINQSGWFSFQGLPYSKDSLHHVLAKKCRMSYEDFMKCKEAVYKFDYTNGEKIFVGKAQVLHEELSKHFDQFEKKRRLIKAIDDELCHHTSIAGWDLVVWPLQEDQDLDVECAKKIIDLDSLTSKDGHGITDQMNFSSKSSFDKFWEWFSPPT